MKYFLPVLFLLFFTALRAQDKLIMYSGDTMNVKVIRLDTVNIFYRTSADASVQTVPQSSVHRIHYANNTTLTLWNGSYQKGINDTLIAAHDPWPMYYKGMDDAAKNYKKGKNVFVGNFFSGFGLSIFGIWAPYVCINTPMKEKNMRYPNMGLTNDVDYVRGYHQQARRMKLHNAWPGYATGLAAEIVVGVVSGIFYSHYQVR
jgi:hypothetical protein